MRNFVTGVVLGGVVAAGGLVVVSQIAPIKRPSTMGQTEVVASGTTAPDATEPAVTAPEVTVSKGTADAAATDAKETDLPVDAQPKIADPAPLADAPAETDEPLLRPLTEPDAPMPASVAPDLAQPAGSGDGPTVGAAPETAEIAVPTETVPAEAAPTEAAPAAAVDPVAEAPDTGSPADPVAQTAESAAAPSADPAPAADDAAATEAPVSEGATPATAKPADGTAKPAENAAVEAVLPTTLLPDPQTDEKVVDGVTVGRLPSITAEAGATGPAPADDAAAVPAASTQATADLPPLQRYARAFDNPGAKPLFAVLLVDTGAPDVARADLAALPFPVTFVLDPMAEGAAEAEAIYRAAGQEVVMLGSAIPEGATASDLEQSFAGLEGKVTEAVALIDTATGTFQNDRKLSAEVVTLLADQGRGLITYDRGLNAADQVARREGLPAAMIFRSLDDDGEDAPLIRRYLDRAAFKAAQEGKVAVIGSTRPETIAALMEWAVEGRASSVALAPITALMAAP